MIGSLPLPDKEDFGNRPGRFGAHNVHENQPVPFSFQSDELVFGAFFNAGVRVYDTNNPFQPRKWLTSCLRCRPRHAPTPSTTCMSMKIELSTPSTGSRVGCTSWS